MLASVGSPCCPPKEFVVSAHALVGAVEQFQPADGLEFVAQVHAHELDELFGLVARVRGASGGGFRLAVLPEADGREDQRQHERGADGRQHAAAAAGLRAFLPAARRARRFDERDFLRA